MMPHGLAFLALAAALHLSGPYERSITFMISLGWLTAQLGGWQPALTFFFVSFTGWLTARLSGLQPAL